MSNATNGDFRLDESGNRKHSPVNHFLKRFSGILARDKFRTGRILNIPALRGLRLGLKEARDAW